MRISLKQLSSFLLSNYNYQTGDYEGYNLKTQSDKITAKIDWNINSNHTLSVKYNYLKSSADQLPSTSRNGFTGFVGGQSPGNLALPFKMQGMLLIITSTFSLLS